MAAQLTTLIHFSTQDSWGLGASQDVFSVSPCGLLALLRRRLGSDRSRVQRERGVGRPSFLVLLALSPSLRGGRIDSSEATNR